MKDLDKITVNTDLVRGHVITFILSSLEDVDKYGYEICKEIETKSMGSYKLKQPTLYSCLKRLESQDYITSYWGEVSNGGRRRYYALTDRGREYLQKEKSEWEYSRALLDKLVSDKEFDLTSVPPFDASELRPYTKKLNEYAQGENGESSESVHEEASDPTLTDVEQAQPIEPSISEENYFSTVENGQIAFNFDQTPSVEASATEETPITSEEKEATTNVIEAPLSKVNYKDAFNKLFTETSANREKNHSVREENEENVPVSNASTPREKALSFSELQSKFYVSGYKFRIYSKSNVNTYYSMKFLLTNKIRAATYWLLYFLFIFESAFTYLFFNGSIGLDAGAYLTAILCGLVVPVIPTLSFLLDPKKKEKAKFDVKSSLINRCMLFLNLALVVTCAGFFVFQANIQEFSTLIVPIILPLAMLLNIPLSSGVYYLLYRSKRFHLS